METYSITFELYGKWRRKYKDPIISMAKKHNATAIDVEYDFNGVESGIDYTIKLYFPDEQTIDKFIRDATEHLKNT